ncbi:MAG: CPBP family intramembrane metalloprotease [Zunongwangia sp.]|uniref:Membrane protein n=2 Tax=Zunongwangia profunda TaxID=398743 RepID=D5BLS4_ZUNPS|nr:membrane protein [Zunongwangia profunda SM-A87]MAC65381.1 CPBP family intramembrane metalloprotease [Flavobacteriaceae bacterium]MAO36656.1 CPBP family intramembrane metalloprotease [Zunongwangia sp.]|tara:strand:+ start:9376 stop:9987 length:612 start_codon:yes stop_codon:yes gene_type:complete
MGMGILNTIFPELDFDRYQQTEIYEMMTNNPLVFFILAVIIAPIIEECLFRSLIKPSQNEILVFICSWILFISLPFIPAKANLILKYSLLLLSVFIIFLFLKSIIPEKKMKKMQYYLHKYYRLIWMLSALIFGYVHVWNYVSGFEFNFILFILIFPRIIAGYFFGRLKVQNQQLYWPILLHAMNNGIVVLLSSKADEITNLFI